MKIVSACLVGVPCRWDGIDKKQEKLMKLLESGDALPLCPEQLGGLSTPREPSEIVGDRVISKFGNDVTEEFKSGAEIVLNIAIQNQTNQNSLPQVLKCNFYPFLFHIRKAL